MVVSSNCKEVLFVVNVDWFFKSHRVNLADALVKRGHRVVLACRFEGDKDFFENLNVSTHPLEIERSSTNLFTEGKLLYSIARMLFRSRADVVHLISAKPVIYGGLLSIFFPNKRFFASISGFGSLFNASGRGHSYLKKIVHVLYRLALKRCHVIVQNIEDQRIIESFGIQANRITFLNGSGVDLKQFPKRPQRGCSTKPHIVLVTRLLHSKGIERFLETADFFREHRIDAEFILVGWADRSNADSLSAAEVSALYDNPNIRFLGKRDDVNEILQDCEIFIYPSVYREGMPKVLLEAQAAGLPVVTFNLPGCADAIEDNVTGYLVEPSDNETWMKRVAELTKDQDKRGEMGNKARARAELLFSIDEITNRHLELYFGE